jgi:ParB-like chromosome segregation protein Spo0J
MPYYLDVDNRLVDELIPYRGNARIHSDDQVGEIAASISAFGWTNPILVDGENGIIAGHGRWLAAKKLGMSQVPVIALAGMTEAEKRAYIVADNKLALNASWDAATLAIELGALADLGFDLSLTGLDDVELATILDDRLAEMGDMGDVGEFEDQPEQPVSRAGDVWLLGPHRLVCGASGDFIAVDRAIESWQARSQEAAKLEANGRSYAKAKRDRGAKARRLASPSRRQDGEV